MKKEERSYADKYRFLKLVRHVANKKATDVDKPTREEGKQEDLYKNGFEFFLSFLFLLVLV